MNTVTRTALGALLLVALGCGEERHLERLRARVEEVPQIAELSARTGYQVRLKSVYNGYATLTRPYALGDPDPDLLRAWHDGELDLSNFDAVEAEVEAALDQAAYALTVDASVRRINWEIEAFVATNPIPDRTGADLYALYCARCHGEVGRGDGPDVDSSPMPPTDFVRAEFDCRSTSYLTLPEPEDLARTIEQGIPAANMPATISMTQGELNALVDHLQTLSRRWLDEVPGPGVYIGDPPAETDTLRNEGRFAYMVLGCWQCHGAGGDGDGPLLSDQVKAGQVDLMPFRAGQFVCGDELEDITRTLATGTSSAHMPPVEQTDLTFIRDNLEQRMVAHRENIDLDLHPLEQTYDAAEVDALKAYIQTLPVWRQIDNLPAQEMGSNSTRRRWALAAFVRHLAGITASESVEQP